MLRRLFSYLCLAAVLRASERPRLAVLTDIGGDPDDQQALVRLMLYANEFDIEALIATASGTRGELKKSVTQPDLIREIIQAYAKVLPNLQRHAEGWPSADHLMQCVKSGNPQRERAHIGEGHDTEGSRWLVERVAAGGADRPLNIAIWGGQTDFAQALWRVKHDRGDSGLANFARRFRTYDIDDQDGLASWMRSEFPGMRYILAKAPPNRDKREGAYRGMYLTGDESLTSRDWIEQNIRTKGPLGALYPTKTYTAPNPHGCMKRVTRLPGSSFCPKAAMIPPIRPSRAGADSSSAKRTDGIAIWRRRRDSIREPR